MVCFWTGYAVSENRRLAPGRGRWHTSPEYRAFKESLVLAVMPHVEVFTGPVYVRLVLQLRARLDMQNILKPVLDALELAGVLQNDRQVRHLVMRRETMPKGGADWIAITVLKEDEA